MNFSPFFSRIAHTAIDTFQLAAHSRFVAGLNEIEIHQRRVLDGILGEAARTERSAHLGPPPHTYEAFRASVPVTRYVDWQTSIDEQRRTKRPLVTHDCQRYQPTSGSSSERKWIPYNKRILREFDEAIGTWLHEIYRDHPGVRRGRHYWSLSWLPTELRSKVESLDDLGYFPLWKRLLLRATMAVPNEVSTLSSSAASKFATVVFLSAASDLTLVSVWSPTFLLGLLSDLSSKRDEVADCLKKGAWPSWMSASLRCPHAPEVAAQLSAWDGSLTETFLRKLWPNLALISAWDTSTSADYADKLRKLFPAVAFQGKGLFATEGVVTIPFSGQYALAYRSHFYEFLKDDGSVVPSWALEHNSVVRPILTTGNGLLRYAFDDHLRVDGFRGRCPLLTFVGRAGTSDLVGEKLDFGAAEVMLRSLAQPGGHDLVCLLAIRGDSPHYALLVRSPSHHLQRLNPEELQTLAGAVESRLQEFFHYKLARELGQLAHVEIVVTRMAPELAYLHLARASGMIEGDVKIEAILPCTPSALAQLDQEA